MDFIKLLGWLKLPPKILVALCIFLSALLFAGSPVLEKLGLNTLVSDYRAYLGVALLLAISLIAVNLFAELAYPWIVLKNDIRIGKKWLKSLSPKEKQILSYYLDHQTRTQPLSLSDGTVTILAEKGVIIRAATINSRFRCGKPCFDYAIQPWAEEYLKKHPELL